MIGTYRGDGTRRCDFVERSADINRYIEISRGVKGEDGTTISLSSHGCKSSDCSGRGDFTNGAEGAGVGVVVIARRIEITRGIEDGFPWHNAYGCKGGDDAGRGDFTNSSICWPIIIRRSDPVRRIEIACSIEGEGFGSTGQGRKCGDGARRSDFTNDVIYIWRSCIVPIVPHIEISRGV